MQKVYINSQIPALTYDRKSVPKGSRTPVAGMKILSPRPLDDGDDEDESFSGE